MTDARLEGCAFRGIAWGGLRGKSALAQTLASVANCMFQYNDFSGMALTGFDFSGSEFRDCRFDNCKLTGAGFRGVRLGKASSPAVPWIRRTSGTPRAMSSTRR